jgi:hypothetical protein
MEGYHLDDCIAEQQRLNWQYYEQKREQDWPQAKAAHTNTDQKEIANDDTEAGEAGDDATEETTTMLSSIMERWYGMHNTPKTQKAPPTGRFLFSIFSSSPATTPDVPSSTFGRFSHSYITSFARKRQGARREACAHCMLQVDHIVPLPTPLILPEKKVCGSLASPHVST